MTVAEGFKVNHIVRRNMATGGAICLWFSLILAGESAPCHLETFIDESSTVAIAEAADVKSLRIAWNRSYYHDLVMRAIYYTRLIELESDKGSEVSLLETIPDSPIAFRFLFAVGDTKGWETSAALRRVFEAYFGSLGKAAARHTEFIPQFLVMNRFADGEAKNYTDEGTDALRKANFTAYLAGLRKLDPTTQTFVCGDCEELKSQQSPKKP